MRNFFAQQYVLTLDQTQAVQHLDDFLASDDSCFILRGYAGTGKTFLLDGIAGYFRHLKKQLVFAAPTGRAAKVIKEKTGADAFTIHKTIYSSQNLTEFETEGVDGSESFKFSFGLRENKDNVDAVYVIDEASMVSNVYSEGEFFRFGSGYLLKDLLDFVKLNEAGIQRKIIFVGDRAQLPPVNMKFSPALSEDLLGEHLPRIMSYELTEVVRQKESSPILNNATALRKSISRKEFYRLRLDYDAKAMYSLEAGQLADTYRELRTAHGVEGAIMIAYANSTVNDYNRLAREQLFPGVPTIIQGDRVILVSNNYNHEINLFNGDFATVVSIDDLVTNRTVKIQKKNEKGRVETKMIPLSFREVRLSFEQTNGTNAEVSCLICEQLLYSDDRDLTSDEMKALYIDFKIRNPNLKPGSDEFKKAIRPDKMFNALRIKFGYAVTCHKAQGGEWPAVIVDAGRHGAKNNQDYFRWLYTAITRSRDTLYVLDAPNYDNGDGLRMVGMPGMPTTQPTHRVINSGAVRPTQTFASLPSIAPAPTPQKIETKPKYDSLITMPPSIPSPTGNPISTDANIKAESGAGFQPEFASGQESLRNIFQKVTELTTPGGYEITDLAHNQYHEIYSFKQEEITTRITIDYNGRGRVSRLRPNDITEYHQVLIDRLQPLIGFHFVGPLTVAVPGVAPELTFPEPFLEEFYQTITSKVAAVGISISDVQHQDWKEVYTFVRDGLQAVYIFHYNSKNTVSGASLIPTKTTGLSDELNALLSK